MMMPEKIVEVVRDSACEATDGLHLLRLSQFVLRLPKRLLCLFALGDVHRRSDIFLDLSRRLDDGTTYRLQGPDRSIPMDDLEFQCEGAPFAGGIVQGVLKEGAVLRRNTLQESVLKDGSLVSGSKSRTRKFSSDQTSFPVGRCQPHVPVWLIFWPSARKASLRRSSA